ncbi:DUF4376 domain-containing protein [Methylobacterium ajmalii]|uniref:DUF4376 domain-containing protein n=1 Tax=Methylobacterium ajmalii TaxID=2738439 RepID=A0ABV0A5D8_9HYPH
MTIYALFTSDGRPNGFYPTDVFGDDVDGKPNPTIPKGVVKITRDQWLELLSSNTKIWDGRVVKTHVETPSEDMLIGYAKAKRYAVETSGITVFGVPFSSDDRSKTLILGAQLLCQQDPNHSEDWWAADGTSHHVDATMIGTIAKAIAGHVSRCFQIFGTVQAGITAGTIKTYAEIDQAFDAQSAE